MYKRKLYLSHCVDQLSQDETTGITKMTVYWYIDFSRLPKMDYLLQLIEDVMKTSDWNNIHPSFSYYDSRHRSFWFKTEAFVKCSKSDKYDKVTGYRMAFRKSKKKAYKTYLRFVKTIKQKISDYYTVPLILLDFRLSTKLNDLEKSSTIR